MGDTILVFYNIMEMDLAIVLGVAGNVLRGYSELIQISQLMKETEKFMQSYKLINWSMVSKNLMKVFNEDCLPNILHNYVNQHVAGDLCFLELQCPYLQAAEEIIQESKSIKKKIFDTIRRKEE